MSLTSKNTRGLIGLLAGLGVVTVASVADAATVSLETGVLLVKQSSNGTVKRGTGAGILMPRLEPLPNNKILAIWMDSAPDSDVPPPNSGTNNNGYWEGKTALIQLNAEAPPAISNTQQISKFDGDRPFNHPRLASAGGDYEVVSFASTIEAGDTTNEYVMLLDDTGNVITSIKGSSLNGDNQVYDDQGQLQPVLNVGQNDGDNHGASEMLFIGTDSSGVDHFIGGYLHNNNDSYAYGLAVSMTGTTYNIKQTWQTNFATPANIGRPTITVTGPTTATACAAKGNNRPPEVGIKCVSLDTTTGQILTKAIVAPSQPDQHMYMNQPTITALGNGLCALGFQMSDGSGRNQNGHFLSANTSMAYTIDCNTLEIKNQQTGVAPFQRHAVITQSLFGNQGQTFIGSLGCSSTGAGGAGLQLVGVDSNGMMSVDKVNNMMPVMWQCDTAWLSYKGLRNPRDQGRDFLHTVGSIPNPGFQDPKGWMPEVSHFAVTLVPAVQNPQADRNSLYMSFVPIAWDKSVTVVMSGAVDVSQIPAGPSPTVGSGGGGSNSPVVGGSDPTVNGSAGAGIGSGGNSTGGGVFHGGYLSMDNGSGGCSVSAVGTNGAEGLEGLALVGLGLAVAASRRRR
jgi:MYXO-CTERM domain-containing protein